MTDHLRVSDAERHEASALLSRHYMDGRLDQGELDERLGEAMRAKTRGDLGRLFVDLPPLAVTPAPAPRPHRGARRLAAAALALSLLVPASFLARDHASRAESSFRRPASALLLPLLRDRAAQLGLPLPRLRSGAPSILVRPSPSGGSTPTR